MSDRSLTARPRPSLVQIHHKAQIATYTVSGLFIALALLSPDFAPAAATAFRAFIAIILN
jgi:hypothetical protein